MSDFKRLQSLFEEALSKSDSERREFLAALRDQHPEELITDLMTLLQLDGVVPGEDHDPIEVVDRYELLELIGEGAFGVVYRARQEQPVSREVAVKVLRLGLESDLILRRFEQERQMLAWMDHPYVARVFDAGLTPSGQSYFVMEFVKGQPLLQYCDERKLPLLARLELFMKVCAGVQHAHQKGIIHRDLKPSNILVVEEGFEPLPKIIDFGVAKATNSFPDQGSLYTQLGDLIGTPEYMSPEQVSLNPAAIDTRADVYALGVLLYQILTGELPFESQRLRKAGIDEMIRIIREVEPDRLSTRLAKRNSSEAQCRQPGTTSTSVSARRLRGDLDWITLKALEKDTTRRYSSAEQLAEDVRRHLTNEPVIAGPPTALYRLQKLLLKYRGAAVAGALVLVSLVVGMGWAVLERNRASSTAEDLLGLSDMKRLDDLLIEAGELWPLKLEQRSSMVDWLRRSELLLQRLPYHERYFNAMPQSTITDRSSSGQLGPRDQRLLELEWHYEQRKELVLGLRQFGAGSRHGNDVAGIEWRLAELDRIERETVHSESALAAWNECQADVAKVTSAYQGLELPQQEGLVPLERNPRTGLWEFWHVASGTRPVPNPHWTHGEAGRCSRWLIDGKTGVILVLLPGGRAWVGSQKDDPEGLHFFAGAAHTESPVNEVQLDAFFLSKYELTQGQWLKLTGHNPSNYGTDWRWKGNENTLAHPVERVSWEECDRTLRRFDLELPTEAQWEFGARAGTRTIWWTGDDSVSIAQKQAANLADMWTKENGGELSWTYQKWLRDGWNKHCPVGYFSANPFGLHGVIGNVHEWCRDQWMLYGIPTTPGSGLRSHPGAQNRVYRGACYSNPASTGRSSARRKISPTHFVGTLGVRPSRRIVR